MPQKDMSSPKTFSEDGPLELQPNIKKYSKGEKNHHSEHREKKYYNKFISEFWYYFLLRWQSQMLIHSLKHLNYTAFFHRITHCSLREVDVTSHTSLTKKMDTE